MKRDVKYIIKRILIGVGIVLVLNFLTACNVHAETFTDASRFTWFTYQGSQMKDTGTGLMNLYYGTSNTINRIQWVYSNYTYSPKYFYDFVLRLEFTKNNSNSTDWVTAFASSCSLTLSNVQSSCNVVSGQNDNFDYVELSSFNIIGNNTSQLWANIYASSNRAVYLPLVKYTLIITRKENTNATGEDISNASQNIINNNNQNTQRIIDNQNSNSNSQIQHNNQQQQWTREQINKVEDEQKKTNDKLDDINDSINSIDISGGTSASNNMLSSVNTNMPSGLTGIITSPMRLVNAMVSSCQPININLPYFNVDTQIPCMSSEVYSRIDTNLINTIKVVINGFLVYRLIASLFYMIKGFKDPENDKVEVVAL